MMDWQKPSPKDKNRYDPVDVFEAGLRMHHIANTAYPIGHKTTMRPYRVPRREVQAFVPKPWQSVDQMGLYVHIPFCEARCGFCEYAVVDPATIASDEDLYFDLLLREFDLYAQALDTAQKELIGFDIGGGTPSVAKVKNIEKVVTVARENFQISKDVNISIETTPKIAAQALEKIKAYKEMGIDRISMGVQTVNPRLLARYGRDHTRLDFDRQATENIRAAGFGKFNIDVMYGFARQSEQSLAATLKHVIDLHPDFVTLYRMRYKGTRVASQAAKVTLRQVNQLAQLAKEMLLAASYAGSPGKNTFSRIPGDVGTSDYLSERVITGTPYLGLGLGAQTLSPYSLAYNNGAADKQIKLYQQKIEAGQLPTQDVYHLSRASAMAKMLSVAFYFGEINLSAFQRKFGVKLEEAFPAEIEFLLDSGLMAFAESKNMLPTTSGNAVLSLTKEGVRQKNGVIAQFYNGEVKAYLLGLAADHVYSEKVKRADKETRNAREIAHGFLLSE
jgi:oxygen-independent coproporphyrinogen-3 oxidase